MARFVYNRKLESELVVEQEYLHGLGEATEPAAKLARAIAPHDDYDYIKGIRVTVDKRGFVRLDGFDFKSWWIEFGTDQPYPTPVFATLRRGVHGVGMRFKEDRSV